MSKMNFDQLQETLYFEELPNGLQVYILPKAGFNKTYATFTTKYGSIDNHFIPLGEKEAFKVPDGIAHFLEHKMFEDEEGDVFQLFSKQGASANAFTSFTRTAYLFSSTMNIQENLETLLDFVQKPYFTDDSVEKEKGIIEQEIKMYDDNPDWRNYFGLISSMYGNHPVRIDIAGTVNSIYEITKEMLYKCYETFYHPSNMVFFVVGNIDPEETLEFIKSNQDKKKFAEPEQIQRFFEAEGEEVFKKEVKIPMNVNTGKCLVGFKDRSPLKQGRELLKHELSLQLLLEMMFGQSGENYQKLYDEGLIDDTFSFDYSGEYGFGFSVVGGDSDNPDKLSERIKEIVQAFDKQTLDEGLLEGTRKKKIGYFLRSLNSPEYIANQFTRYRFNDMDLFDVIPVLESIKKEDLQVAFKDHFNVDSQMSKCFITPKGE
ncbi:EF-P 5-aminopentanol modification-associated protein YfmH [Evansella cellulosilytica]|uniref:Peptidase M16 domain protein n=1 Tax=Evansella cellulosilytica (strain ATCC 21833 / DSM 2522 / FERM P-1141 / JCM 9156 / N-4) TaxID=649639 RepID=E6TS40_EVAC2|nr:pitrilysin family protein [Evansella cellulosilytica]ADU30694.1 peptidase M16 domain protein [Evansella cellulosilytica DSM 2522]